MELKHNIAIARKRMGISQEQLAEKCGVSRQAVTKWETGESEPTISKLEILSAVFNISMDELVTGKQKYNLDSKPQNISVDYNTLTAITCDLTGKFSGSLCQMESSRLLHLELLYGVIKTKYLDSNGKIYEEYLLEKTTQEERAKIAKLLMCESVFAKEIFQDYIDGIIEIDVAFDKLLNKVNEKWTIASQNEDKKRESQIAKKYYKVHGLLNRMQHFEDYNEKKLSDIDQELQSVISEQDVELQPGRIMQAYLYDMEQAWNSKDKKFLEELDSDWYALEPYVWSKIK